LAAIGGGRELTYSPRRLRVPAALALVRRSLSHAPEQRPMPPNSEPWFVARLAALPPGSTIERGSLLAQEFGHCLVVGHWPQARALLAAREGSAAEESAFAALSPYLGACLPQGLRLEINPKSLREYIGEPFYHVLAAAPASH
jgi:hypothetical protein